MSTPIWTDVTHRLLVRALGGDGGPARLRVEGSCMSPVMDDGDWVWISSAEPVVGDAVVARLDSGEIVCHRVLRRQAAGVLLAGDRSRHATGCGWRQVIGKVEGIERDGRIATLKSDAVDRALTRLHAMTVSAGRVATPSRLVEALRRRLRSAYSKHRRRRPSVAGGKRLRVGVG